MEIQQRNDFAFFARVITAFVERDRRATTRRLQAGDGQRGGAGIGERITGGGALRSWFGRQLNGVLNEAQIGSERHSGGKEPKEEHAHGAQAISAVHDSSPTRLADFRTCHRQTLSAPCTIFCAVRLPALIPTDA